MKTVKYNNVWPWGRETALIADNGKAMVFVALLEEFAYIHDLVVHDSVRGRGLGNQLLEKAEREARIHLYDEVRLTAEKGSAAEAWYRRHGYQTPYKSLMNLPPMKKEVVELYKML